MAKAKTQEQMVDGQLAGAFVPENEQPYEVPENWVWTRLNKAVIPSDYKTDSLTSGVKYIGLEHIEKNGGIIGTGDSGDVKSLKSVFSEGDILYGKLRPYLNKHDITTFDGICSTDILVFKPSQTCDIRLVNHYLDVDKFIEYAISNSKGINLPRVSQGVVLSIPFPLPPRSEQHRIVERIENLFDKLDRAKELTQSALDSFETRKAAILHKAFTGELTAKWREENGVGMESWEESDFDKCLLDIETGKSFRCIERPPQSCEVGVVKVSSVTWGAFNADESKTCIEKDRLNQKAIIKKGDFLFSRANTIDLVGACVIVEDISDNLMLSDKILRFIFRDNCVPKYVLYYLRCKNGRKQIEELSTGNQESMRNISQASISRIIVSLPTLPEQQEIVRILDGLLDKEQRAREMLYVIDKIDLMKKAILARAFRGELGTNDPSEESAVELLK